jgi:hypothetical protein
MATGINKQSNPKFTTCMVDDKNQPITISSLTESLVIGDLLGCKAGT